VTFRNEVVLVSWKKSEKYVPSLERTFDIPLQIAAYMGALNFDDRYPFRVRSASEISLAAVLMKYFLVKIALFF
jgi:hypothetical protein